MPKPSKPKIKRAVVYLPERAYYRLASALKREAQPRSVSQFFRDCAKHYHHDTLAKI